VSEDELVELLDLAFSSDAASVVVRAREIMSSKVDPTQLSSQLANLIMDVLAGKSQQSPTKFTESNSRLTRKFLSS
jgi:DNA polymerase III gamma/tau subunit